MQASLVHFVTLMHIDLQILHQKMVVHSLSS
jgi:hypothetical protein